MRRIALLAFALCAVIYVRSTVVENIHPWEFIWMVWVGSTCLISGCLGYAVCEVVEHRRR